MSRALHRRIARRLRSDHYSPLLHLIQCTARQSNASHLGTLGRRSHSYLNRSCNRHNVRCKRIGSPTRIRRSPVYTWNRQDKRSHRSRNCSSHARDLHTADSKDSFHRAFPIQNRIRNCLDGSQRCRDTDCRMRRSDSDRWKGRHTVAPKVGCRKELANRTDSRRVLPHKWSRCDTYYCMHRSDLDRSIDRHTSRPTESRHR
jgi:hypothetical protein